MPQEASSLGQDLCLKVLENRHIGNQIAKQNGATNSLKPGAEEAIVILGSGRRIRTMERVRYGAILSQATRLPILIAASALDATSSNKLTEA